MRRSQTALIAIVAFGFFIVLLIVIGIATTSKYIQTIIPQIQNAANVANTISTANGGINNTIATVVNNATNTPQTPGQGATSGSGRASTPQGAAVFELGAGNAANPVVDVQLGANGVTVINGTPRGTNIGARIPAGGGIGYKIVVANNLPASTVGALNRVIRLVPGPGVTINGNSNDTRDDTAPGFTTTYVANVADVYTAQIPTALR